MMKLEFEVIDLGLGKDVGVRITLDGKSVVVEPMGYGFSGECDVSSLPKNTCGRQMIEEIWDFGMKVLQCDRIAEGMTWHKTDEDTLREIWDVCT